MSRESRGTLLLALWPFSWQPASLRAHHGHRLNVPGSAEHDRRRHSARAWSAVRRLGQVQRSFRLEHSALECTESGRRPKPEPVVTHKPKVVTISGVVSTSQCHGQVNATGEMIDVELELLAVIMANL